MSATGNTVSVSSFWSRILALILDTLALSVLGFVLGIFLEDVFIRLGEWGKVIGFFISLAYFSYMNSECFGGQTLGKRAVNIKVVDSQGKPISLSRSHFRALVLTLPFSLNGLYFPDFDLDGIFLGLLSLVTFGGIFSIVYLYIFNRRTRQSLHDLLASTFVVNVSCSKVETAEVWKAHYVFVGSIWVISCFSPLFLPNLLGEHQLSGIENARSVLHINPVVSRAAIVEGSSTLYSTGEVQETKTFLSIKVSLYEDRLEDEKFAEKLARVVVSCYPEALRKDVVQLQLSYGYDIGISANWSSRKYSFEPIELIERLE
ncbi:RDD family protein [Pseudoteredinibacter isoporae]|uniref:Putative RDD family membrane protein YckC n=1 Tax=Pseudoteredinibacter isoporae TaxID=570281 RepID=A0A7X0MYK3_9GAMM|nr:RDD family protein [Pseudoteredinibacter isoporae]MBB6522122.1 putative RDD family membrane protein YckC [Pseudoteredinibacter isoporae]NHO87657.1 RDD family protein [Pseudoteredinibacter isoporae]NIB24012.1 RDD family protein [Pseudoteredinibacter isoporae]